MPTLTVTRNAPAGVDQRLITFEQVLPNYQVPGQFISVTIDDLPNAYFALANSPAEPVQLLIKMATDITKALGALKLGQTLVVSEAMGTGFDLSRTGDRELLILCTGSGIAAIRPVIRAELRAQQHRSIQVLYGVRSTDHRAFLADLEAWANAGITVRTIISQDDSNWDGDVGYVHQVAEARGLIRDDVALVLCGQKAMQKAVSEMCLIAGLPDGCVVTNF